MGEGAHPAHLTVIFDGECGFCTRSAAWLTRLDRRGRLVLRPYQRPGLERFGVSETQANASVWVVGGGVTTSGAKAISVALDVALGTRLFRWVYRCRPLGWVGEKAYAWVARNRHRLPGVRPWCETHPRDCGW